MDINTLHPKATFRRQVLIHLGIDYPKMSTAEWYDVLHNAIEGGKS
jgi:hypothetical protein